LSDVSVRVSSRSVIFLGPIPESLSKYVIIIFM